MGKQRTIFHIDVNSAFLSWTAVYRLQHGAKIDLRDIPSVVGGDPKSRHGIVLAKSIPAKKYRIHTGETLYAARAANCAAQLPYSASPVPVYIRYNLIVVCYADRL
jgi:nucleotidyltransferase/DNA polymerase involved in DNA repair